MTIKISVDTTELILHLALYTLKNFVLDLYTQANENNKYIHEYNVPCTTVSQVIKIQNNIWSWVTFGVG